LEDLEAEEKINRDGEMISKHFKTSVKESLGDHELKKQKPWFDKGCRKSLDQRKQATIQWLQDQRK
jgi:hypothetical protein